jgi:hypothetical protein
MLADGVVVPVKSRSKAIINNVVVFNSVRTTGGRKKEMTINDPCLPDLGGTTEKATKA